MKVYVAKYFDPEGIEIIGVFSSKEKANLAIQNKASEAINNNPESHAARYSNYSVNEFEIDNVDIISNNPEKDFLEALEKGEKLLGISLRKEHDLKTISYETISTLMDAGFDINSLELEVYPDEPYKISALDYLLINIFLAKKGNQKLEIEEPEELTPQI